MGGGRNARGAERRKAAIVGGVGVRRVDAQGRWSGGKIEWGECSSFLARRHQKKSNDPGRTVPSPSQGTTAPEEPLGRKKGSMTAPPTAEQLAALQDGASDDGRPSAHGLTVAASGQSGVGRGSLQSYEEANVGGILDLVFCGSGYLDFQRKKYFPNISPTKTSELAVLVSIFGLSRQFYYDLFKKKSERSVDFKKKL